MADPHNHGNFYYKINPKATYKIHAMVPMNSVYGSCVPICSMGLHPMVEHVRNVVSEIGEDWSPNVAPPHMADAVKGILSPKPMAVGMAIGATIAMVPMELPVAKEITPPIKNTIIGNNPGVMELVNRELTYSAVPISVR